MSDNDYDPIGGHTKEEADAAYAELYRELHGEGAANEDIANGPSAAQGMCGAGGGHREEIAVVGHIDPDTDSICSAIAYARLKNVIDPDREYIPYRAGTLDDETEYVLRKLGVALPELLAAKGIAEGYETEKGVSQSCGTKVILVDHNERMQIPGGVDFMHDVIEIIDHHRLGKAETAAPVYVRCQPCGATCTIIYEMYSENGIIPDTQTAGLLCAGIISDTNLFRSENTGHEDRLACAALANIAGLDIEAFAEEMPGR